MNVGLDEAHASLEYYDSDYPSPTGPIAENFDETTEFQGLAHDLEAYLRIADKTGGPVLEPCCGTGRVAIPLLHGLRSEGVIVGDNEPYSGRHTADYSLDRHAEGNHLAHAAIELRQDHILTAGSQHIWAERLARVLQPILADEAMHQPPKWIEAE